MNQRNQPQQKEPSQMAIEIYADLEEVAAEVAEVEVTAEVETTETDEVQECNTIAPEEVEPTDAPEASSQEEETGEVENVTAVIPNEATVTIKSTWTRTTNESDLISQLVNAKRRYRTAEQEVEEIKEQLKEAKAHMEGCASRVMKIIDELENDAPANRPLFANLDAKVEAVEEEGDSREEEPTAPTEPSWKSLTVDALPDITPKTKEQLRDGGINTLAELADLITRCEHDSTAAWPKGIGKVKQTAICDALITVQDLERCQGSEGVPVEAVYPTVEAWYAMSDEEQIAWLNERAIQLDSDNRESLICDPDHAYRESWVSGTEAAEAEEEIANCDVEPGPECDAWLLGWLWQSKQEDVEADDSDDSDAEE
jgi:hypothetical protein